PDHLGDRREVVQRIEWQLAVHGRAHPERRHRTEQHGVTIGRGARYELGGDVSVRAGTVLYDDVLSEAWRRPARHGTRNKIVGSAGRKTHQEADGLGWVRIRGV